MGPCHPHPDHLSLVSRCPGDGLGTRQTLGEPGKLAGQHHSAGLCCVAETCVPLSGHVWTPGRGRPQGARGWARPLGVSPRSTLTCWLVLCFRLPHL